MLTMLIKWIYEEGPDKKFKLERVFKLLKNEQPGERGGGESNKNEIDVVSFVFK